MAEPGPVLAPFVASIWWARWSYAELYEQVVVPFPSVHLTLRPGRVPEVNGVATSRRIRLLEGEGRVTGLEFRPGGFRPFLRSRVAALTDRVVTVADVPALRGTPAEPGGPDELRAWLEPLVPPPDPGAEWAAEAVALIAADPTVMRVDQLAQRCGTSVRGLQRRFAEYVGVGPKWVIRRYREGSARSAHPLSRALEWCGSGLVTDESDCPRLGNSEHQQARDRRCSGAEGPVRQVAVRDGEHDAVGELAQNACR